MSADATHRAAIAAPGYAGRIRQPFLLVAAGRDEVVSTPAIKNFGMNLLAGRHLYGWRGRVATRWVLTGFIMVLLAGIGSRFVLEVILGRG